MRRRSLTGAWLLGALLPLATGCAAETTTAADRSDGRGRPTEAETREAYLNTPLVSAAKARSITVGTSRAEATEALGAPSSFTYRRGRRSPYVECAVYPIAGTQVRDAFGGIEADEWELCFGTAGRLTSKRRIRAGG